DSSDDEAGHGRRVASVFSPPVSDIVQRGLKVSQNLYMQNLLLMVGAQQALAEPSKRPFRSTETYGTDALAAYLEKIGVPRGSVLLEDGAGLSRRNLLSADALTRLLVHLGSAPEAAAFRLGLPIAGVDGSLRARMQKTAAEGRVHAKTGYMAYTWSLAGYAASAANERLAFVLLLNNYSPAAGAARGSAELDTIAVMLAALEERSLPAHEPTTAVSTLP
ncbi:MAG: D-alanyl-D-alanine carboxypeptidase, partial [Dokdonella sp.]